MVEIDVRINLLNSLLSAPHAELEKVKQMHEEALKLDPALYGPLAVWYFKNGEVRDHKQVFIAHLLTSEHKEYRDAGFALLQDIAPYEVERVLKYMKEKLGKLPRSSRTAIRYYLKSREQNNDWFDSAAARSKTVLKGLYASLHITPGERANSILFLDKPPEGSLPYAVKLLAKSSPGEQAEIIHKYKIPYPVAVGAVRKMMPSVMIALIDNMTPSELVNNLNSLKKRGAFDNPEVKALIEGKLEKTKTYSKASTLKSKVAGDMVQDEGMKKKLDDIVDTRVKKMGRIKKPTALFLDKSGSLDVAIEVAKHVATLLSTAMEDNTPLYVYAFDNVAIELKSQGKTYADWTQAFRMITANGGTSIGSPLSALRTQNRYVEQIMIITDENENASPYFVQEYPAYATALKIKPNVIIVDVGSFSTRIQDAMRQIQAPCESIKFAGDYTSLPNIIPLLSRPSRLDLLQEILATPLPKRPLPLADKQYIQNIKAEIQPGQASPL